MLRLIMCVLWQDILGYTPALEAISKYPTMVRYGCVQGPLFLWSEVVMSLEEELIDRHVLELEATGAAAGVTHSLVLAG